MRAGGGAAAAATPAATVMVGRLVVVGKRGEMRDGNIYPTNDGSVVVLFFFRDAARGSVEDVTAADETAVSD